MTEGLTDSDDGFRHSTVTAGGSSLHVVQAGDATGDPVLFLHGWPQSWRAWAPVMRLASGQVHAIAIDLPGIGESTGAATDGSKRAVADTVHALVQAMGLRNLTVVGHDAGAMVTYAYLRSFSEDLKAAVLMDVAVAGISPWDQLAPSAWHFGFHAIAELPERLAQGRQREYFDYFYDAFSLNPAAITADARAAYTQAYASDTALTAGFNWYRSFGADAEDNQHPDQDRTQIDTPTRLILSDRMAALTPAFDRGFQAAGLTAFSRAVIPGAGHFLPEEAPEQTWQLITDLIGR